jgi:hypothetical protein
MFHRTIHCVLDFVLTNRSCDIVRTKNNQQLTPFCFLLFDLDFVSGGVDLANKGCTWEPGAAVTTGQGADLQPKEPSTHCATAPVLRSSGKNITGCLFVCLFVLN